MPHVANGHLNVANGHLNVANGHLNEANGHLNVANGHLNVANGLLYKYLKNRMFWAKFQTILGIPNLIYTFLIQILKNLERELANDVNF